MGIAVLSTSLASAAPATRGGRLDQSFDADGKLTTGLSTYAAAMDVVVQPDRRVVAAGASNDTHGVNLGGFAVVRYLPNGGLDATFQGGAVVTPIWKRAHASAVALQPDGRIVAAGFTNRSLGEGNSFAVLRYEPDGDPDPSFGGAGIVTTDFDPLSPDIGQDFAEGVLIQRDGRIVAVGTALLVNFGLARYEADGMPDSTFGEGGTVVTDFGSYDGAMAGVLQPDGKILAAGFAADDGWVNPRIALARYLPGGSLDQGFGEDGRVVTELASPEERATGIALQADRRIVVAVGGTGDLAVVRYLPDGRLDRAFGSGGLAHIESSGNEHTSDVAIQRNGKIVAAGSSRGDFAIARFLPNGTVDRSFGSSGLVVTDLGSTGDALEALTLQRDGRIVGAGQVGEPSTSDRVMFGLVRYTAGTCSVPKLKRLKVPAARSRLARANCRLGSVRRSTSGRGPRGRVIAQRPSPGREAPDWARVDVVVGRSGSGMVAPTRRPR